LREKIVKMVRNFEKHKISDLMELLADVQISK